MKIEWLVADATAVGSPDIVERAILGLILTRRFFANLGYICGQGAILLCRNPLLSSNKFIHGHSMNIKWLVADVTAVGASDIAERAILGVIVVRRCFGQFRPYLWSGSHFVIHIGTRS